jgi:transposase InsO family protein
MVATQTTSTATGNSNQNAASLVAAAEACRWDGMQFGTCNFKLEDMESWLDSVRAQLYTRKASFLLSGQIPGDDNLQTMCLLALKASLPAAKRPLFSSYQTFSDAFEALVEHCSSAKQSAALQKQSELTNLTMLASETLVSYLDRASALWGSLQGSAQAIDEASAVQHTLRGLHAVHGWFVGLVTGSNAKTFVKVSNLAMQHASSRVASSPEMQFFPHGGRGRSVRGRGDRGRHSRGYHGKRPFCPKCSHHHFETEKCHRRNDGNPDQQRNSASAGNRQRPNHTTVGHLEFCNAEICTSEAVALSLCVDSGATHVVTPHRTFLSNYSELPVSAGSVKLASDSSTRAVGSGTLTLKSRTTGNTISFTNVLHVPSARRTLICLGKALRAGVFWHFNSVHGGYITDRYGYWGDMHLAPNDLLFLDADIVQPTTTSAPSVSTAAVSAEISNAELFHRRLGHPGRSVTKFLASQGHIPADAAGPMHEPCVTCATCKIKSVPRAPLQNPATRPLQRMHVDLIVVSIPGLHGERYTLVMTDQYSGYIDAVALKLKSDAAIVLQERILFYERQLQPLLLTEIMSDCGGEFINTAFSTWCRDRGIMQISSPPYTSRSNGRAENSNLHLETLTRSLMTDMAMPADLWPEVVRYGAAYLLNRRPRRIQHQMLIPYTAFTGQKVSYAHLRVIGSPCVVLHKPVPRHKFAARGTADAVLLGYVSNGRNSTCMYRVWMPAKGRAISVVDIQVLEQSHRWTPQVPRTSASVGSATTAEHPAMAWESINNDTVLVPGPAPPAQSVTSSGRNGGNGAGGGQGSSTSGAPLPLTAPVVAASASPQLAPANVSTSAPTPAVDTSGCSPEHAGTPLQDPVSVHTTTPTLQQQPPQPLPMLTPIAPHTHMPSSPILAPPPSALPPTPDAPRRSTRSNLGVPAPKFDGSAHLAEHTSSKTWPWVSSTPASSASPTVPARNYLAEVYHATGDCEVTFDASRTSLAHSHAEVLTATAAPRWQREAPRTLAQAYARPDVDSWVAAMHEELHSLHAKAVYELVHLPQGHQPIDLRWVFSYKLRPDGAIERYKARLVAKGFTQEFGVDFFEVWAPTGRLAAYRVLLSHAAVNDLPVYLLDFKTAFLNGPLHEEIYVTQPPGFSDGTQRVWRLHRALYGLKQAANAWHSALVSVLTELGYSASKVDPAVFLRSASTGTVMLHTHVDDCAATGPTDAVKSDYAVLLRRFDGRELGEIDKQVFLGLYHERCWSTHTIYLSQPKHVEALLSQYGFCSARPLSSPMDHKVVLTATTDTDKCEHSQLSSYAAIVGSLMYIACCSRPDLCFTASILARFMARPSDYHLLQAHRALRYLSKTSNYRLAIGGSPSSTEPLTVWSDSDLAGCVATRRSVAGHVVCVLGSIVYWRSIRQSTVAKSTMIAEYYAASSAADEAVYFRTLLHELGYADVPTPLMCDNQSAVNILGTPVVNDKSRYAAINAHFVRERAALEEIKIVYVPTGEMLADCMTKALTPDKHVTACKLLGVAKGEKAA